eukprot:6260306-Amphidinium_carterae.1
MQPRHPFTLLNLAIDADLFKHQHDILPARNLIYSYYNLSGTYFTALGSVDRGWLTQHIGGSIFRVLTRRSLCERSHNQLSVPSIQRENPALKPPSAVRYQAT